MYTLPRIQTYMNAHKTVCLTIGLIFGLWLLSCGESAENSAIVAAEITETVPNQIIGMEYRSLTVAALNRIDVTTGERTPLWEMPAEAWVHQVAPINANAIGLSYSPVPEEGEQPYQRAGIYALLLAEEGAALLPILESQEKGLSLYAPVWTMDGRYIFYVRNFVEGTTIDVTLMRYEVATGEQIEIAKDGIWPHVSAVGERLTYITVNPETQERGLVVADWDGENVIELAAIGRYFDVDSPRFSNDGQFIYFAAAATPQTSWLDWLFGVRTAYAHPDVNFPVEWWRVPVAGGRHEQLSAENRRIIFGDFSATGDTLYFTTTDGLFSMSADGGSFIQHSASATMRTIIGQAPCGAETQLCD